MQATFATFYTDDNYLEIARRLERCCDFFNLPFQLIKGVDYGSWQKNCNQKPRLLAELRADISGPIVWMDADCVIHSKPALFSETHSCDAILWRGGQSRDKWYIGSQVMYWADSPTARSMIDTWAKLSEAHADSLADPLLKQTCDQWLSKASIDTLPESYRCIFHHEISNSLKDTDIIISCNERASDKPDGVYRNKRPRFRELSLPFGG